METFSGYWPFVQGIHRFPVNSPHKGQWCRALMFSFICTWINGWVNNSEAGDLRCHSAHYDVIVAQYCWWPDDTKGMALALFFQNIKASTILCVEEGCVWQIRNYLSWNSCKDVTMSWAQVQPDSACAWQSQIMKFAWLLFVKKAETFPLFSNLVSLMMDYVNIVI